jgi:alkanesulfonate monooxygenase SsuD/methylene tetrahydromethanopterin reductase-like flavin-dependent oxidoreductase (luciferase family)
VLGLGVGWQEAEHTAYGIPYPPLRERFDRLEEAILLMRQMWQPGPGQYRGKYYELNGPDTLPKPAPGRPPILFGGGGERRTLKLVARYGDEWSAPGLAPAELRRKLEVLAGHCEHAGRDPKTIRCSMLSMGPIGATPADVDAATQQQMERTPPPTAMSLAEYRETLKERGGIVGGVDEIVQQLGTLAEAGLDEALFVYAPGVPEFLASEVLPRAAAL